MNNYQSTDDDLPGVLFRPQVPGPVGAGTGHARTRPPLESDVQLAWEHPGLQVDKTKEKKRRTGNRANNLSEQLDEATGKKHYVHLDKKRQMACWSDQLRMAQHWACLNFWEQGFVAQLGAKFDKYPPEIAKWVTVKQYEAIKAIAKRVLTR